ncbi:zinc dependent phospholipase C family protein [Desnuesiella massiliensis]|uniref:zinc dependent phospholipase C family protein n=1 Tax=Desnuesiella massiliensis TaxID=1650662 RepID=UPI0006E36EAA|nr:zinc dependent phospholipase C family protein [Desnuesiella massiliensis]
MPFQMTHLCIAEKIHQIAPVKIKDLSQFYLGVVAPDAVHNRSNYISNYKKASHLCVGEESWGAITNNDEWVENVSNFIRKNKNSENYDFVLGYCTHILSDIYNNITVWLPFKQKYQDEISKGYGGLYHQESEKVEIELALTFENKKDFWKYLKKAEEVSLDNIIFAEEVRKHKDNILNHWYKGKKRPDVSSNKIVTVESTMKFIDDAANFVVSRLPSFTE